MKVTCAIIMHENRILITQRSAKMSQPQTWEFPGGKVENGESETECIHRELLEELNITITITGKLEHCHYEYPSFKIELVPFLATYANGNITLKEHMNFRWVEPHELKTINWSPADVCVAEQLLQKLKHSHEQTGRNP